jgi:peptide/nickel transport system permease protein
MQGGFLVITVTVIVLNLISDLLYARLDPRITT